MSQEEAVDQEAVTEEVSQTSDNSTSKIFEEFSSLKEELAELKAANSQLIAGLTQKKEPEKTLSDSDIQRFTQDPASMARWVKEEAEKAKAEIRKETQKQTWDRQAEDKFPALKTNKDFQKRVVSQMREMMAQGEYTADNPMLLYRAAQIVSSEFAQKPEAKNQSNFATSVESRMGRSVDSAKPKISDNDPRVNFLRLMGITDAKKIEKFKSQLSPYMPSQRRQSRRLSK